MNDFYDSTASRCVSLVEKHAPAMMIRPGGITNEERARMLHMGLIRSIATPPTDSEISTIRKNKDNNYVKTNYGKHRAENIHATAEILALPRIEHGDAYRIIKKHNAHEQTVYKMLKAARGSGLPRTKEKSA